jgi:hypothetical protein
MYLKHWRRPRVYRSIIAHKPRGIYQMDIMYLSPLWNRIFNTTFKQQYQIVDYALVSVDVYSRYVKAVGLKSFDKNQILEGVIHIARLMGGYPDIISGDNQIINALYQNIGGGIRTLDPRLPPSLRTYATSPKEVNKNAIVERMIRTIKDTILKILERYDPVYIYNFYKAKGYNYTMTNAILFLACYYINNRVNRTIKNKPHDVFEKLERNNQEIVHVNYPLYKERTIVLKIPERAGEVPLKTFDYDPEPYVIVHRAGRKYVLQRMLDWIRGIPYFGITTRAKEKLYKPYEIRPFKSGDQLMKYLNTPLVKYTLTNSPKYGPLGYKELVDWVTTNKDWYTSMMRK